MSLCIAWKYEEDDQNQIYLASDSCVVHMEKVMPFGGIKVLSVPVKVISPIDAQTQRSETLFDGSYGLAFIGSYLSGFLLKELVAEVLSHLQLIGSPQDVTFDKICELVHQAHRHFHEQIRKSLKSSYEIDFFLGGFCGRTQKVRVAKFFVQRHTLQPACTEILRSSGFSYDCIGNEEGQARFRALMSLTESAPCRPNFACLRRLWDIIRDPEFPFVAGAVQYGQFVGKDFQLLGAFDLQNKDGELKPRTFIRGTDVEQFHTPGLTDFHIHYSFGNPFHEDIQCYDVTRTFWTPTGDRHVVDEQITVVPSDRRWQGWFEEEMAMLRISLGDQIPIEHIGSTSVADMAAVPIIDILIGIERIDDPNTPPFRLDLLGYEFLGDKFLPGHLYFRKRGKRSYNVFVTEASGSLWQQHLRLREILHDHEELRKQYAAEKMRILNRGSWTLLRYMREKSAYIERILGTTASQVKNPPEPVQ